MGSNYLNSVDNFKLIIVGHFEKVFVGKVGKVRYLTHTAIQTNCKNN